MFFLNSQMYGVKTLLFRFEHKIIIVFSKHVFYRFFKDVLDKTLTFEVPTPPKMEAENYEKNVFIRKIRISRFGVRFGSQNGAKLVTKPRFGNQNGAKLVTKPLQNH